MASVEIRISFHVSISTYSFIYFFKYVFLFPWIEYVSFDSFQKAFFKQYYKLINFFVSSFCYLDYVCHLNHFFIKPDILFTLQCSVVFAEKKPVQVDLYSFMFFAPTHQIELRDTWLFISYCHSSGSFWPSIFCFLCFCTIVYYGLGSDLQLCFLIIIIIIIMLG